MSPTISLGLQNQAIILGAMKRRDLQADATYGHANSSIHGIIWNSGTHTGHLAQILCFENGAVEGHLTKITNPVTKTYEQIVFNVDLGGAIQNQRTLSLDEALEYIRFFMWARHD